MGLPLANVQTTDTFQTWLNRTNQIIETAANNTPIDLNVTQSLTANTAAITNSIDVGTFVRLAANTSNVPYSEGKVFYDGESKTLAVYKDQNDIVLKVGQDQYLRAFNTGSTIPKGTPVYISGALNGTPIVAPADATSASTLYAVGFASHSIGNNSFGYVLTQGIIKGVNTSGIPVGSTVHVAPGGGFQAAAPTYPNYAHDLGIVTRSDATDGAIYIFITQHYLEQLRVENDTRIGGNLTVEGNFNVLGTEVVTTLTNLQVSDTFIYLNSGDTQTANSTGVTGLNDLTFKGHYNGGNNVIFYVKIDSTGGGNPDSFSWSLDNFATVRAANVAITGAQQPLAFGIKAQFVANTGHTVNDVWTTSAAPINVDVGINGNRNTGNTGIGYTHMGVFFDVSDNRFKFFEAYRPEISGNIDTGHPTFALGIVEANSFIGSGASLVNLNASEITAGVLSAARLATSGVTANTYGSASKVPVITVDNKGRITELTTTNVAGVSSFTYTTANTTFTIGTADGNFFNAAIANATTSDKGVASFSSNDFAVTSGVVTIKNDGVTLGTQTTGDYVASITGTTNQITVTGSGGETAAVTLSLPPSINANTTGTAAVATTVALVATDTTNASHFITFVDTATGNENVRTDTGLTYNPSTGILDSVDFNSTSDERLKKNIKPIENALDKVMQLAGVEFDWVNNDRHSIGLIAQQVEAIVPEVVDTKEDGYKSISYGKLTGVLIEAIKELKAIVDNK